MGQVVKGWGLQNCADSWAIGCLRRRQRKLRDPMPTWPPGKTDLVMHKHGTEQSTAAVRSVELVSYVARDVCGRSFKVLLMFLVFHTRDAPLCRNSVERL